METSNGLWQHFFKRVQKNYNPYVLKMADYPEYLGYNSDEINLKKNKWSKHFCNDFPIFLEIGSGSGNFTNALSEKNKDKNYLALEIRFKRLVVSAQKSKRRNAKNIYFVRRLAEEISDFIGENELEGVYINFADPWEKKLKHRVIQPKLFDELDIILKKNGKIFIKTDHDGYYSDILNLVRELDGYKIIYHTPDLHNSEKNIDNIRTEFEELFLHKHQKNINYIEIEKIK
ncbi:MAG: tRNA (guanosine(46)-N7)-methyltransferase TrmB [Fusobacteriaceae bacterium]